MACAVALGEPSDAEDLLIDIFSEIWEKANRFDATRGTPLGHLMGLARSRVIDRLRSRRSALRSRIDGAELLEAAEDLRGVDAGPLERAIGSERRKEVIHALQALPIEQRQALELAYFEGLTHAEVALRLSQPLGTIKSRIRQALTHLRDSLVRDD